MREYLTIRTASNRWGAVGEALKGTRLDGGRLLGLFAPQIGASVNTVFALAEADEPEGPAPRIEGMADVVSVERTPLSVASERNMHLLEDSQAMFTNRWFHVRSDHAGDFETATIPVWDGFETDTHCAVVGLWHAAPKAGVTSYLLVARYDDLAAWSASRFFNLDPKAPKPEWAESFAKRRDWMTDTSVIATRCIGTGPA